jgi:hypothetical protein
MPNLSCRQLCAFSFAILLAWSSACALPKLQSKADDMEPVPAMAERLGHFGDQGNGTYLNPILPADFKIQTCCA